MQDAGMVKISKVGTSVKGHKMNYYCATNQSILITPPERKMHSLFASLKKISRFAAIGMAGLISWAIIKPEDPKPGQFQSEISESSDTTIDSPEAEWSPTYQRELADESIQMKQIEEDSMDMAPPEEPESEPHQIGETVTQLESERVNTDSN